MGNQPITIGLRVDGPPNGELSFKAGSVITGRVYLSVPKQPQPAHSVVLKLIGREELVVHYTNQEDRIEHRHGREHRTTVTRDNFSHSTYEIFKLEYALYRFAGRKIPVGQYEYPFELHLPDTLPSTMTCKQGQSNCEVKFELVAEVYQQPNSLFQANNARSTKEIRISSLPPITNLDDTSLRLPLDVVPITKCCCSRMGTMALETHFNKTTVSVNDRISVGFRCQNKSTANVHTIRVRLQEVIEWTSEGHKKEVRTTLQERNLDASEYPELEPLRHRPRRSDDYNIVESLMDQQPWHSVGPLIVPQKAKDTYHGRGIQVRHTLSVTLLTSGCCSSNPDVSTIIDVYRQIPGPTSDHIIDTHYHDGSSCGIPSAPPSVTADPSAVPSMTATAPSDIYDDSYAYAAAHASTPVPSAPYKDLHHIHRMDDDTVTMVQAEVLPPDWHPQTAEVVNIPMAEAIVLGID